MNYIEHLNYIKSLSDEEIFQLRKDFLSALPGNTKLSHVTKWPYGMPASIAPKIVFIGVSMGASPSSYDKDTELNGDDCLFSKVDVAKKKIYTFIIRMEGDIGKSFGFFPIIILNLPVLIFPKKMQFQCHRTLI
jgi:hypothetical protein